MRTTPPAPKKMIERMLSPEEAGYVRGSEKTHLRQRDAASRIAFRFRVSIYPALVEVDAGMRYCSCPTTDVGALSHLSPGDVEVPFLQLFVGPRSRAPTLQLNFIG